MCKRGIRGFIHEKSSAAESETSTFTFIMPAAHIHLKGIFSAASDTVVNQAGDVVSSGTLGNGKAVADNGTAEMTLSNAKMDVGSLPENASLLDGEEQDQTITLDMGQWCSYPRWFMEKIAERNDLTVKLQFEYLHKQYEVAIPAGKAVDTACDWYGPLKLCELYGYTVQ